MTRPSARGGFVPPFVWHRRSLNRILPTMSIRPGHRPLEQGAAYYAEPLPAYNSPQAYPLLHAVRWPTTRRARRTLLNKHYNFLGFWFPVAPGLGVLTGTYPVHPPRGPCIYPRGSSCVWPELSHTRYRMKLGPNPPVTQKPAPRKSPVNVCKPGIIDAARGPRPLVAVQGKEGGQSLRAPVQRAGHTGSVLGTVAAPK